MNNKQARIIGRCIILLGCLLIVVNKLWPGMALVAAGIGISAALGRCPHCGRALIGLPLQIRTCPRCQKRL